MKTFDRATIALCMFLAVVFFAIGPVVADFDSHVEKKIGTSGEGSIDETNTVEEASVENAISGERSIDETNNAEKAVYGTICTYRGTWTRRGSN